MRQRLTAKIRELKGEIKRRRHWPVPIVGRWLRSVALGHYWYYGLPLNSRKLASFRHRLIRLWLKALRRRSQRHRLNWARMTRLVKNWIPPAKCSIHRRSSACTSESKAGAQCGSSARWDLCGGRRAIGAPTATPLCLFFTKNT
jgi:hypothetical protein